jgi:spermidine/putrescine transport system ATP-binding protein
MNEIVSFKNVSKSFGEVKALNSIDLTVRQGEFLSILGPSGCGKSTLLRICAGFEKPGSGSIFLDNKNVTHLPAHKRPVNMVFQNWALFPHMTAAENIAFGLMIKKQSKKEIDERVNNVLELVRMKGYEDRYPDQISGGQAQRIALARAMVLEPKVLLLDEPLGSLDLKLRQEMQFELINIHKKLGMTFIYVTHDQDEALTMSDRIIVMNDGAIIQDGPPDEIYRRPNSVFSSGFIGESILFSGKVECAVAEYCIIRDGDFLIHCAPDPAVKAGQDVTVSIRPENIVIDCSTDEQWDNQLDAKIVNTIFKGPVILYQIALSDNRLITVHQNAGMTQHDLSINKLFKIGWSGENCVILTR